MSALDNSFRQNLQSFIHAVDTPLSIAEKQFDKLKELFENKGLAIFLLTKQTYHDLHQATSAPLQQKRTVNLDVRPLDLRKFKTDSDFNRLDRLIVFNKSDNTVAFVEMAGDQKTFENVEIILKLKQPEKGSGKDQIFTNIQAKKLTKDDFDSMSQVVTSVMKNLQVRTMDDSSALIEAGEFKAVVQTRGGRSKESKNSSESSKSEEKDLPASEREPFVDAAEKIQKEIAEFARQEHELEKAGEKKREAFLRNKNKVDFQKEQNRSRIAKQALNAKTSKRHRKVRGV